MRKLGRFGDVTTPERNHFRSVPLSCTVQYKSDIVLNLVPKCEDVGSLNVFFGTNKINAIASVKT